MIKRLFKSIIQRHDSQALANVHKRLASLSPEALNELFSTRPDGWVSTALSDLGYFEALDDLTADLEAQFQINEESLFGTSDTKLLDYGKFLIPEARTDIWSTEIDLNVSFLNLSFQGLFKPIGPFADLELLFKYDLAESMAYSSARVKDSNESDSTATHEDSDWAKVA